MRYPVALLSIVLVAWTGCASYTSLSAKRSSPEADRGVTACRNQCKASSPERGPYFECVRQCKGVQERDGDCGPGDDDVFCERVTHKADGKKVATGIGITLAVVLTVVAVVVVVGVVVLVAGFSNCEPGDGCG